MAFPDQLLEQANHLANRERKRPRQASLRRAVSTAYYALFHLLVSEAALNWKRADQRTLLARYFEHGKMKAASEKQRSTCQRFIKSNPTSTPETQLMAHLFLVAATFFDAQEQRHTADYDSATQWTRREALALIKQVEAAFSSWQQIKAEPAAQAYLLSLLGNPRGTN